MKLTAKRIVLLCLLCFSSGVFCYLYMLGWFQTAEFPHTIKVFIVVAIIFAGFGLVAANSNLVYEWLKDREFRDYVAEKVAARQDMKLHEICNCEEITMAEMQNNAEKQPTYDQKAHLRMLRNNSHFKVSDSELSEKDKLKKFVHGSTIDIKV